MPAPFEEPLAEALDGALPPDLATRPAEFADQVRPDGASVAARQLLETAPLASA